MREVLGGGAAAAIHQHLRTWKAGRTPPAPVPEAEVPPALLAALGDWAKQYAQEAGIGAREALAQTESEMAPLLATIEQLEGEREDLQENITRLNAELRNARLIATDALVGKAKDQLAIDGKESQLADLRAQLERSVASSSAQSDAGSRSPAPAGRCSRARATHRRRAAGRSARGPAARSARRRSRADCRPAR